MVDRELTAVSVLRANVVRVLRSWGIAQDSCQTFATVLVLTELVTNANRYGRPVLGLIDVDMWLDGGRIIVTVADGAAEAPVPREAGSDDESGRGLKLIGAYAEATGYEVHFTGKRVWAVIAPQPDPVEDLFFDAGPDLLGPPA